METKETEEDLQYNEKEEENIYNSFIKNSNERIQDYYKNISSSGSIHDNLINIIEKYNLEPTIVNPTSNFVVCTYWWGYGNLNNNTARPCVSYYESEIIYSLYKLFFDIVGSKFLTMKDEKKKILLVNSFLKNNRSTDIFLNKNDMNNYYKKIIKSYIFSIFDYIKPNGDYKVIINNKELLKDVMKLVQHRNEDFKLDITDNEYMENLLYKISKQIIVINITYLLQILFLEEKIIELKKEIKLKNYRKVPVSIKNEILNLETNKEIIKDKMKKNLNTPLSNFTDIENIFLEEELQNLSIFGILNYYFRYVRPTTYDEMIQRWMTACISTNCNYLAIEYPEFAVKGGYQMAINAKPLFIKKALELCEGRRVLYIDGDMYIRQYPHIFDIDDVDFMARGWWIDPRSSYKMDESIMYDPYVFETSGGTMFFSNSYESKSLLKMWIDESSKETQLGKADDRILSLIFNSYKLLLSLKVIQLPIEYLWLTLDYDNRFIMDSGLYNPEQIKNMIFIEHPECLTSEDTATDSGASSNRQPRFYSFLDSVDMIPTSELVHEYIMFPSNDMTNAFKSYYDYMKGVHYIDDGNEYLFKKKLILPDNTDITLNEQPLYIIDYDNKFGNINYDKYFGREIDDEDKTFQQVSNINFNETSKFDDKEEYINIVKIFSNNITTIKNIQYVVLNTDVLNNVDERIKIYLILYYLNKDIHVIYKPNDKEGYNNDYFNDIYYNISKNYDTFEFIYFPIDEGVNSPDYCAFETFFKQKIMLNQVILFRPTDILIKMISMFEYLEDLSDYLKIGSYEFISRIRICYLFKHFYKKINNTEPEMVEPEMVEPKMIENENNYIQQSNETIGGTCLNNCLFDDDENLATISFLLDNNVNICGDNLNNYFIGLEKLYGDKDYYMNAGYTPSKNKKIKNIKKNITRKINNKLITHKNKKINKKTNKHKKNNKPKHHSYKKQKPKIKKSYKSRKMITKK